MAFRQNHGISVLPADALCRSCFSRLRIRRFLEAFCRSRRRKINLACPISSTYRFFPSTSQGNRFGNAGIFARQRFCRFSDFSNRRAIIFLAGFFENLRKSLVARRLEKFFERCMGNVCYSQSRRFGASETLSRRQSANGSSVCRAVTNRQSTNADENTEFVFFDKTPGGAGFVKEAKKSWNKIIAETLQICSLCNCEKACYNCLKDYYNQSVHELLNRLLVKDFLNN